MLTPTCPGHGDTPHLIGLNMRYGGVTGLLGERLAVHVRHALHHMTPPDSDASTDELQAARASTEALCDRADAEAGARPDGMLDMSTEQWQALITCVADAADYMSTNNYAGDSDFPEDQAAAVIFCDGAGGLDICWRSR